MPTTNFTAGTSFTYTVTLGRSNGDRDRGNNDVPVNDAPAGTDKTITTNEDTGYTFTAADFDFRI